ncbi:hypothetical protein MHYP_G00260550 [Metynnis hypsauchen]
MDKTFALKRQEVVQEAPLIADFKTRWPALFRTKEVSAEFERITMVSLLSWFFSKLDLHSAKRMKVFARRGGIQGQRIKNILVAMTQDTDVATAEQGIDDDCSGDLCNQRYTFEVLQKLFLKLNDNKLSKVNAFCRSYVNNMVIREPPLEDYRPRICMKRTARVGTVCMRSWHSQDAALGSEEEFSSSDQSGEDSEEERLYFEKRIDPKEDFCNR